MNYLIMPLSDLRDSVLYIGNLFSLPQLGLCVYITFYLFGVVRVNVTQSQRSSQACNATFPSMFPDYYSPILDSYSNYLFVILPPDIDRLE
jgi:hypothetical protein